MTPRRLIEPARLAGTSMLRTQSDARLVDLVRAGHAAAFEAIVQRYRKPLLKHCGRLLPASRAEDAVQQTFLKAYQAMVSGDADLNLRPWLYRIAHNSSLNLLRQNGWSHEQLDESMDGVPRPDQALELKERLRATVDAVNELPERQRNAVLLREVEGLSYEEIALALGVGDGAVRQLLHRARATLRAGASALTPLGLVERLAVAMASPGADPSARVAEVAAGVGAGGGAIKLGAAVLATGALATGAITGPLAPHKASHRHSQRVTEAGLLAPSTSRASRQDATVPADDRGSHRGGGSGRHESGSHHSGPGRHASHEGGGSGERGGEHRSGSGEHSGSGGGGDDHHSGSGSGGSGESSPSGSSDGGSSGSGSDDGGTLMPSGGSGSGSNDGQTITSPTGTNDGSGSTLSMDGGSSGSGSDGSTSGDITSDH